MNPNDKLILDLEHIPPKTRQGPLEPDGYRWVTIRGPDGGRVPTHEYKVRVKWICPKPNCGKPRGEPHDALSFDGSCRLYVSGWDNECGHIDYYSEVVEEAKQVCAECQNTGCMEMYPDSKKDGNYYTTCDGCGRMSQYRLIGLHCERALQKMRDQVTPFPESEKDGLVILNRFLLDLNMPFEATECRLDRANRRVVPTTIRLKEPLETITVSLEVVQ